MLFRNEIPGNYGSSRMAGHGVDAVSTAHCAETFGKVVKINHKRIPVQRRVERQAAAALSPTPHTCLVIDVMLAELVLERLFLSLDKSPGDQPGKDRE